MMCDFLYPKVELTDTLSLKGFEGTPGSTAPDPTAALQAVNVSAHDVVS